jgi:hypothetical protein
MQDLTETNEPEGTTSFSYWTGRDALAPVPLHVGSAIIRPVDKGKLKSVALETVEKQANQQIAMLRKQAEVIMAQVKEIENRVKISAEIYQSDISFEPVIGHVYHLYENEGKRKLSMIGPEEWGRSQPIGTFVATVRLNADRSWDVLKTFEQS